MSCRVTELHPYDLNIQSALAQVTGAFEGGWDSWFVPPGQLQMPVWGLERLLVNPAGLHQTVTHRFCLTKGGKESGFMLWNCIHWPSGFLNCACMGLTLSRQRCTIYALELQPARSHHPNPAHFRSIYYISTSMCLTTGATLVYKHEFPLAGKLPIQNLRTEK